MFPPIFWIPKYYTDKLPLVASPSHKHIVHQDGWKQSSLNVKWRVSRTEDTLLVLALRSDSFNGIALPRPRLQVSPILYGVPQY